MMLKISFFIFFCGFILLSVSVAKVVEIPLNDEWKVEVLEAPKPNDQLLMNKVLETSLPTNLHLDLLQNNLIDDPFFRNNHEKLKWVSQCKVKYSRKFKIQSENAADRAVEIVFKGIDTYSSIKLNGKQISTTNNSFQEYVIRIQSFLKLQGENILEVIIEPTKKNDQAGQKQNRMPFKYAHTRKPCYQYSWDWAPFLETMGIWKEVNLRIFDDIRINYVWARNKMISSDEAIINFAIQLELNLFKDEKLSEGYEMIVEENSEELSRKIITEDSVYLDVSINEPQFWWPNGIGKPHMYDFQVKLMKDGNLIQEKSVPYGIRVAELDQTENKFTVKINGYPVYCKGANYVPPDMLYPRFTNSKFKNQYSFEKILDDAVESNFNMIRIWGGGQYQNQKFYEMASRKGIMIFQDFMFSDSVYPSTANFLYNVEEQIKQQVRMIRNYPSIVLWCGNNEVLQGIKDWGWGSQAYRKDYQTLFQNLIPEVLKIESPDINYIPSSPVNGVGNFGFQRGGDFHYWGVWAGQSPFQSYQSAVGPFNSQFGTQALPVWHSIKNFTVQQDRSYQSRVFLSHEKHNSQFNTLKHYMKYYMSKSKNFENQAFLSGVVQAYAIQIAIVAQRTAKPKSYGTLYWQFNDAWPAISWAAIDYYGRWKPLQYMAKRRYQNLAIFTNSKYEVIAVNDYLKQLDVTAKIMIISFSGQTLFSEQKSFTLNPDSTYSVMNLDKSIWSKKGNQSFVYCQISSEGIEKSSSTKFFQFFKNLSLPKATLKVKFNTDNNQITLESEALIKNLFIDHSSQYIKISDNYFDLIPKVPIIVKLEHNDLANIKDGIIFNSVREASLENQKLQVQII